jgi:cytochrome c oxidase subunit II
MSIGGWARFAGIAACALAVGGCDGVQSALAPQGPEAARVARLFWGLTIGSAAILIGVVVLGAIALLGSGPWRRWLGDERIIVAGGLIFPVVTLTVVLAWGLIAMHAGAAPRADDNVVRIGVVGERWWWRVIYRDAEGRRIESANELRIPAGRPIEIELTSADVIHSFWVPRLAGKLDMIPGRRNVLRLMADAPGVARGQCAEYCGGPHALMSFHVVAMAEPDFARWLAREAEGAEAPHDPETQQGRLLFMSSGCGACHAVRGTAAVGTIGPDLTHVGGRLSLAAATLPNDEAAFARWIRDGQHIKPENLMPPFGIFNESEVAALARYMASLK